MTCAASHIKEIRSPRVVDQPDSRSIAFAARLSAFLRAVGADPLRDAEFSPHPIRLSPPLVTSSNSRSWIEPCIHDTCHELLCTIRLRLAVPHRPLLVTSCRVVNPKYHGWTLSRAL